MIRSSTPFRSLAVLPLLAVTTFSCSPSSKADSPGDGGPASDGGTAGSTGAGATNGRGTLPDIIECPEFPPSADPRCGNGPLGSGPSFLGSGQIRTAFTDAARGKLVLAVAGAVVGSDTASAVWTVDVNTGARAVLSGTTVDPTTGFTTVGAGMAMSVTAAALGPDGNYYVYGSDGIFRVDPATGARTLLRGAGSNPPGSNEACTGFYSSDDLKVFAVDGSGRAYVRFGHAGAFQDPQQLGCESSHCDVTTGIFVRDLNETSCKIAVSYGDCTHGSGFNWACNAPPDSLVYNAIDHQLYLGITNGILRVDPETGNRTVFSAGGNTETFPQPVGMGDASPGRAPMFFEGPTLWTTTNDFQPLEIDSKGNRTLHKVQFGDRGGATQIVGKHPDQPVYFLINGSRIVQIFDPATGRANLFSGSE